MKTFERFMGESIVLYCLPGKAWALGLSYPWTSSRVYTLRYMASSRRSCQTTVVLFNTETQRLQRFSSRGSPCLLWLYPRTSSLTHWTSSQFYTLRSWRLPDAVRTIKYKHWGPGLFLPEFSVSAVVIIYA